MRLERRRERMREKHCWERETSIGCPPYRPWPGIESITQVCFLTRNQTANLLVHRMDSQLTEPLWPGQTSIFLKLPRLFQCRAKGESHCLKRRWLVALTVSIAQWKQIYLQSFVFMGQKYEMNEHVVARTRMFLCHFWTTVFVWYYLSNSPESGPLKNSLPEA